MKALLIEFDLKTGERAGGISPHDPKLPCYGWQDLGSFDDSGIFRDKSPAIEIRLVMDDRDLSQYEGVPGVTILEGKEAINEAITANIPAQYAVKDTELLVAHLKERGISLDTLAGKSLAGQAKALFAQGLAGIVERKPELVE